MEEKLTKKQIKDREELTKFIQYCLDNGSTAPVIRQGVVEIIDKQNEFQTAGEEMFNNKNNPKPISIKNCSVHFYKKEKIKIPKRFKQCKEDKWEQPVMEGYLMKCCDCGLIHEIDFRIAYGKTIEDNRVQLRARRIKN